jgi:DNA-binding NarL/FixJ family response regulator
MREGLRGLFEKYPNMEVVAEAEDGQMALKLLEETDVDIVVMDVAMPNLNGIETTRQIVAKAPRVKVIALSMYSDRRFIMRMLAAGASGYLLKDCAFEELAQAIRAVVANQIYLSPTVASVVVKNYVHKLGKAGDLVTSNLTTREREVLQLLAEGRSVKDIASNLSLSVKTIETYRQQIMNKLEIHSIAELTKFAIREGFTSLEK